MISQTPHVHQPNFLTNSWRRVREDEETNLGFKETSNFWWYLAELKWRKWREMDERGTAERGDKDEESLPMF